jgi:hypothetical protein
MRRLLDLLAASVFIKGGPYENPHFHSSFAGCRALSYVVQSTSDKR